MDRRNFLQGVFGGVTAAGLIVSAKASDVSAYARGLAPNTPLLIDQPPAITPHVAAGEHLYNSRGELVAMVTAVDITWQSHDVTSAFDNARIYVPGPPEFEIRARGIGSVSLDKANHLQLRGVPKG
jgi:hypothetical protein